jgi:succinate dehydrogenase / fumarate reductase cytochrome b subunit
MAVGRTIWGTEDAAHERRRNPASGGRRLPEGVRRERFWWYFMRISGLILVFMALGPDVYNWTQTLYHNLPARLGEILLMAALVYHSLNGLRVIVMDFWPRTTVWYRPLTYGVIAATVVAMVPLSIIMITPYAPWNPA